MALPTVFTPGDVFTAANANLLRSNQYNLTTSTKTVSYVLLAADVGTRVLMNAAGSTTITANTSLFAAGDTLEISNIGAGVCTITSGTCTVTSSSSLALAQYQSGTLFFTSASAAIFIASAVTASAGGLVPMPPTTVGKTGASSTATASAVGGVTFTLCETLTLNGVFTSAYSNYRIVWGGLASINPTLQMRLVTAGTPASATDYNRQQLSASSTTVVGLKETSQTLWIICNNINTVADNFSMDIFNPKATKETTFNIFSYSTHVGAYWQSVGGVHVLTTSYDGIQFIPTAGNFSGIVTVYGYNQ